MTQRMRLRSNQRCRRYLVPKPNTKQKRGHGYEEKTTDESNMFPKENRVPKRTTHYLKLIIALPAQTLVATKEGAHRHYSESHCLERKSTSQVKRPILN